MPARSSTGDLNAPGEEGKPFPTLRIWAALASLFMVSESWRMLAVSCEDVIREVALPGVGYKYKCREYERMCLWLFNSMTGCSWCVLFCAVAVQHALQTPESWRDRRPDLLMIAAVLLSANIGILYNKDTVEYYDHLPKDQWVFFLGIWLPLPIAFYCQRKEEPPNGIPETPATRSWLNYWMFIVGTLAALGHSWILYQGCAVVMEDVFKQSKYECKHTEIGLFRNALINMIAVGILCIILGMRFFSRRDISLIFLPTFFAMSFFMHRMRSMEVARHHLDSSVDYVLVFILLTYLVALVFHVDPPQPEKPPQEEASAE